MHRMVREKVPYLDHDEPLTDHIEAVASMFESGKLLEALPEDSGAYDW
jgi:histidine ammonia-lyase